METKSFLLNLLPQRDNYVAPILIYINTGMLLFLFFKGYGLINVDSEGLIAYGGNIRDYTQNQSEWWRLLTSVFLHSGLYHYVGNMMGLYVGGIVLERLIGKYKFLLLYIVTGTIASYVSLFWHDSGVSIGASGAIFGLSGFILAVSLMKVYPYDLTRSSMILVSIFILFNLVLGITGGVDNAAHIGGLLSGFLIGMIVSLIKLSDSK